MFSLEPEEGQPATVVLPFTPMSKNRYEKMEGLYQASYRKKWRRHLAKHLGSVPACERVRVEIEIVFGSRHRRDWQNYAWPLLWDLPDALVDAGVIDDDTPDRFTTGPDSGIVFSFDTNKLRPLEARQRTIIRIYPIEAKVAAAS